MSRVLLAVFVLLLALPAWAEERILAYDSRVDVQADGSLEVTEHITVRAEGSQIRRGIYRDYPTRYRDRYGNRVVVGFEVVEVLRDGKPEPWFTESLDNGVRVNTGNDDLLPVPAQYTYTLRYRTTRQLGFFADHDELYWNAIGTGWAFPIDRGSVEVHLPQPVPVAQMHAEGYTGAQGMQGDAFAAETPAPGVARWQLTQPLAPQEGMTIVLSFPKGLVPAPSLAQRGWWLLTDNRGVLVALAGLVGLLAFCLRRWHRIGRDPRPGVIIARYDPPAGHSPAGLRYLREMKYDARCFSSDLLAMAVDGQLQIERDEGFFKDDWQLQRISGRGGESLSDPQQMLLGKLFTEGPTLELDKSKARLISIARNAHDKALVAHYEPEFLKRNGGSIGIAFAIALGSVALAFGVSDKAGELLIIGIGALMVVTVAVFAALVKAPTTAGRTLLDEIEGLKLYLGVAERDELARLPGPDAPPVLDARRYETLLPYAVALEVEDAWTEKFTLAVGVAAAAATTSAISWYRGGGADNLGSLSKAVGNSLSSQIASSSSPPGSSSGSGGGGSSGGGGGGGGGGGR